MSSLAIRRIGSLTLFLAGSAQLFAQTQGQTRFDLAEGQAVVEWITSSTFRFCRAWGTETCDTGAVHGASRAKVTRTEDSSKIVLSTEFLRVEIDKQDLHLRVLTKGGDALMEETGPIVESAQGVEVERVAATGERFYGLGARMDKSADARGQIIETTMPFLISSKGYGLYHNAPGSYVFDLARSKADRYRVTLQPGQRFDYWFYYGPTPKAVYEEHIEVVQAYGYSRFVLLEGSALPSRATLLPSPADGTWASLADEVRSLVNASLSGILSPAFDVGPYASASPMLFKRAMQFGALVPLLCDTHPGALDDGKAKDQKELMAWRQRLVPFLLPYVEETNRRGFPMIHPLVMQFPKDEQGAGLADEFLLGDEILAAPIFTADGRRSVYLPMGRWTDLNSNKEYPGRQTIQIEAAPDETPLFLRNGTIVPIAGAEAGDPMVVHYLPKLAGEFFLYEPDVRQYTQLHAAPALDLLRLEAESKVARSYEWVVHNMPSPRGVATRDVADTQVKERKLLRTGAWYYDTARRNIHILVEAPAGETRITHIAF